MTLLCLSHAINLVRLLTSTHICLYCWRGTYLIFWPNMIPWEMLLRNKKSITGNSFWWMTSLFTPSFHFLSLSDSFTHWKNLESMLLHTRPHNPLVWTTTQKQNSQFRRKEDLLRKGHRPVLGINITVLNKTLAKYYFRTFHPNMETKDFLLISQA